MPAFFRFYNLNIMCIIPRSGRILKSQCIFFYCVFLYSFSGFETLLLKYVALLVNRRGYLIIRHWKSVRDEFYNVFESTSDGRILFCPANRFCKPWPTCRCAEVRVYTIETPCLPFFFHAHDCSYSMLYTHWHAWYSLYTHFNCTYIVILRLKNLPVSY